MKKVLLIVVTILILGSIVMAGCTPAPAPAPEPTPPTEPDWTPPIPGMLKGEEDIKIEVEWGLPMPRENPPEGFDLTFTEYLYEKMTEKTGGRLTFTNVSKTTMGKIKEMADLIGSGMIDMGFTPTGDYYPDLFPLSAIILMPGWGVEDGVKNTALWTANCQHPLVETEFARKNFRYLHGAPGTPMYMTIRKGKDPITSVADLEGLQVRGFGYVSIWAEQLGMIPSFMPASEAYEALQKGIIDASDFSMPGLLYKKVYEVVGQLIEPSIRVGGGGGMPAQINLDTWNSMPQYMKDLWAEAIPEAAAYGAKLNAVAIEAGRKAGADNGMKFVKLPPEETNKMLMAIGPAWEQWVEDTEKQKNGEKIREYIKDSIATRNKITGEEWMIYQP